MSISVTSSFSFSGAHSGSTVGFYNVTPVARPAAYTQTYSTASRTQAAITAVAPASTAATNITPYGFSQTQADAIKTACIALVTDMANVKQVLNQVIDDLQSQGLLQ